MRIVHHSTHVQQERVDEATCKVQDEAFFQAQLLRSVTLALTSVGFDSVSATALEAFRAQVDSCTVTFLPGIANSHTNTHA